MASDENEDGEPRPRATNSELLRELRQESREHGQMLASLTTQVQTFLGIVQQLQTQNQASAERQQALERDAVAIRERLVVQESRPVAMTEKERADLLDRVKETTKQSNANEVSIHDLRNRVQIIKEQRNGFAPEDEDDIRRYLAIARNRNVDDAFTPDEVDALRAQIKAGAASSASNSQMKLLVTVNVLTLLSATVLAQVIVPALQHAHG